MLGAGALGRPRGMVRGGRREEGSGWGTRVYLWRIHVDTWQNQYNIVKLKNKKIKAIRKILKTWKKKVGHERLHNVWFHSCEIFRIGKSIGTEQISSYQRRRGAENGEWELMNMEFLLRGDENVLELVLMMVVQLSEYIENHWIVCFKRVCFMVCGLYLHWNEKQLPGLVGFCTLGPIPSTCCISGFFLDS